MGAYLSEGKEFCAYIRALQAASVEAHLQYRMFFPPNRAA
jgi:hypothetical protein